jgi:hypothetical protein
LVEVAADEVPVTLVTEYVKGLISEAQKAAEVPRSTAQGSQFCAAGKGAMTGPAVQEDHGEKLQSLQQGIQRLKRDIEAKAQRTLEESRSVRRKVTLTPSMRAASSSKRSAGLGPKAARSVEKELDGIATARSARVGDPWDFLICPEDDLRDSAARMRLQTLMRAAAVVHFGIDCKTFTRARGIPVKGANW